MNYFNDLVLKGLEKKYRKKTIDRMRILFDRYRYQYTFNRRNVAELFKISENGASQFLRKCSAAGIIQKTKRDSYRFTELVEKNLEED